MSKTNPDGIKATGKHLWLDLSLLQIDPDAQRGLRPGWVKELVAEFDPELFGELVVSRRKNGDYYVVNGQHRTAALREMGYQDQKVPCLVYEGLSQADEAALFLGLSNTRTIRTFDKFRVAVTAGDAVPCDIERIVRAQGLTLSDQKRDGSVSAVAALQKVYLGAGLTKENPAALARTLRLLKLAWGPGASSFEGSLILGAGLLLLRYNSCVDDAALAAKLSKVSGGPSGIIRRAKTTMETKRRPAGHCVADAMVNVYNVGRRKGQLDDWWSAK